MDTQVLVTTRRQQVTSYGKQLLTWAVAVAVSSWLSAYGGYYFFYLLPLVVALAQTVILGLWRLRGIGWWPLAALLIVIVGPTGGGEQLYQDLLFGSPIDHQHWGTQLNLALFGATGLDMGDLFFRFGVTRALIALLQWPILLRNDARPSLYAMLLWVAVNSLTEAALIKFLNFAEHLGLPAVYQYWLFAPLLKGLITGGVLLWLLHSHLAARH